MKKSSFTCAFVGGLVINFSAVAADVSYDYVGIGYTATEVKGVAVEPSGVELKFSKLLSDSFYFKALGDMTSANDDESTIDYRYEQSTVEVGFGYKTGIFSSVDIFTDVSYLTTSNRVTTEDFKQSDSESGYSFEIGTKMAFTHEWNADLYFKRMDYESDGISQIGANVRYAFEKLDVIASMASGGDRDSWGLGVQYKF